MKLNCIIAEDEQIALKGIIGYAKKTELLNIVGTARTGTEAVGLIIEHQPDLAILDIQMPGITGLDLVQSIANPPMVIFTTAYPQYALEGFEVDALDYLLKPFDFSRFLKSVNRAVDRLVTIKGAGIEDDHCFLKVNKRLVKVYFNDMLYIESMGDYLRVHTTSEKLVIHSTLKQLEEILPSELFMQVHRSYLVRIEAVKVLDGNMLELGEVRLPIGPKYRDPFLKRLFGNEASKDI